MDTQLVITDYAPEFRADFKRLNIAWISKYFTVETHDLEQLDDPEHHILAPGGLIFLAHLDGQVVGTVALVPMPETGVFELAKMAVDEAYQGRQIGKKLGEALITRARALGARRIVLESNRRLAPALALYERLGFREVPLVPTPYARADIRMEMDC